MTKENDLILNRIANPDFSIGDFKEVGVIAGNTSLESEEAYSQHPMIKDNPYFQTEKGEFDKVKFHKFYTDSQAMYNVMADDNYVEDLTKQVNFHRDDMFAPNEQKRKGPDFEFVKTPNPFRQTSGIIRLGVTEKPTLSADEIAQTQRVLLNPLAVLDGADPEYGSSPNDSWFEDFWDTRVMAQWDEEGSHLDPITGQLVKHQKGDLKLNENGTFYYESLDGRDVYGRRVLNKMNTLTTDGSNLNQYDFFDSDDIEQKSIGGSIMKNLALAGSMFIPYVGTVITGLSIAHQAAGLFATFGKMLTGSDSPTLSAIEGWVKSTDRRTAKTEYAQNNIWCWENFIGLIGDVAAQLKEQRVLFEYGPALFKGNYGWSKNGQEAFIKGRKDYYNRLNQKQIKKDIDGGGMFTNAFIAQEMKTYPQIQSMADWSTYIKGYNKLGELLSRTYMTGVTVADTYGEAKVQGASDAEAALLTMGYAAAEWALLSTGVGQWLFPELRASKKLYEQTAKTLVNVKEATAAMNKEMAEAASKEAQKEIKKNWVKNIFNKGKQMANDLYTANKNIGGTKLTTMAYNGLAEGIEETSEELLADFSKACFNLIGDIRGDDTRLETFDGGDINKLLERYSMSLVGGAFGGAIGGLSLTPPGLENMDFNQAVQQLVYMHRNGQMPEFYKVLDKMDGVLGNKYKSTKWNKEANAFEPGTAEDNQDLAAKNAIRHQAKLVEGILNSHGLNMSDDSYLRHHLNILGDLKYQVIANTAVAGKMLQKFNSLATEISNLEQRIREATPQATDEQVKAAEKDAKKDGNVEKLQKDLDEKLQEWQDIIDGKATAEFADAAMFELTPMLNQFLTTVSLIQYAENETGKRYGDIAPKELNEIKQKYNNYVKTEKAENVLIASKVYAKTALNSSQVILKHSADYENQAKNKALINVMNEIENLFDPNMIIHHMLVKNGYANPLEQDPNNSDQWSQQAQENAAGAEDIYINQLIETLGNSEELSKLEQRYRLIQYQKEMLKLSPEELAKKNMDFASMTDEQLAEQGLTPEYRNNWSEQKINEEMTSLEWDAQYFATLQMANYLGDFVNQIIEQGFINSEVRQNLISIINKTRASAAQILQIEEDFDVQLNLTKWLTTSDKLIKSLNKLNHTPIEENLNQFSISVLGKPTKITEIVEKLNTILRDTKDHTSEFAYDATLGEELDEALNVIDLYAMSILGAGVDNGNINNLFGYNKTLNEIHSKLGTEGWIPLAEIDSNTANILIQDLNVLRKKLRFYKQLFAVNQGKRLEKNQRVDINKSYIFFDRLKRLVDIVPDDLEGKDELKQVLESLSTLSENLGSRKLDLDKEDRTKLTAEYIKMGDAVNKFFEQNPDLLTDSDKLSDLLVDKFNLFEKPTNLLTEDLKAIDDNAFFWWLMTNAAIKSSAFHKRFASIISDKIAPLPSQMLAVQANYASIVNGEVFKNAVKAYKKALIKRWEATTTKEEKIALLKANYKGKKDSFIETVYNGIKTTEDLLNLIENPRFSNIMFTEGIPGSGKTAAVFSETIELLKKFHNDDGLLDNVWYIHGASKNSAETFLKNINLEGTPLDITKAMKLVSVKPIKAIDGVIDLDDLEKNEFGEWVAKSEVKALSKPPTLVFIDETTRFSMLELDTLNKAADKYGFSIIAAGDLDQSKEKTTVMIGGKPIVNGLYRMASPRTAKLGVSFRPSSSQKSQNNIALQAFLQNPSENLEEIKLHFFEDEQGLYGDKIISSEDNSTILENAKDSIDRIFKTATEKVGFVYYNEESPIYKYIMENYADMVEPRYGNNSQGLESQYYIIESPFREDQSNSYVDFDDVYTALTRAEQGSLFIQHASSLIIKDDTLDVVIGAVLDTNTIEVKIPESAYALYSRNEKAMYDEILADYDDVINYRKRNTKEEPTTPEKPTSTEPSLEGSVPPPPPVEEYPTVEPPTIPPPPPPTEPPVFEPTASEPVPPPPVEPPVVPPTEPPVREEPKTEPKKTTPLLPGPKPIKGLLPRPGEALIRKELVGDLSVISEEEYKKNLDEANSKEVDIKAEKRGNARKINMVLYSFNTLETGVLGKDSNGKPLRSFENEEINKARIDSINGLINIDQRLGKPIRSYEEYIKILSELRYTVLDQRTNEGTTENITLKALTNIMQKYFGISDISYIFAFKSNKVVDKESDLTNPISYKYAKSSREVLYDQFQEAKNSSRVPTKSINIVIGQKDIGDILEIPLLTLTNPLTLLTHSDFLEVAPYFPTKKDGTIMVQRVEMFKENLRKAGIFDEWKEFVDLCDLYAVTSTLHIPLPNFNINMLKGDGPHIIGIDKNTFYEEEGFAYTPSYQTINELAAHPGVTVSEIVISTTGQFDGSNGEVITKLDNPVLVHPGHPMVLVSFSPSINKHNIYDEWIRQQENPNLPIRVREVYILPPKVKSSHYVRNLHKIFTKEDRSTFEDLGNLFTAMHLTRAILNSTSFREAVDKGKVSIGANKVQLLEALLNEFDEFVESNSEDYDNPQEAAINFLESIIDPSKEDRKAYAAISPVARSVDNIFKNFVHSLIYGSTDDVLFMLNPEGTEANRTKMFDEWVEEGELPYIYYHVGLSGDNQGQFVIAKTAPEVDGKPSYAIRNADGNLEEFEIIKVDSSSFEIHVGSLITPILQQINFSGNFPVSAASYSYQSGNATNTKPTKTSTNKRSDAIVNSLTKLNKLTGVPVDLEKDSIDEAVKRVNSQENGKHIAFKFGKNEVRLIQLSDSIAPSESGWDVLDASGTTTTLLSKAVKLVNLTTKEEYSLEYDKDGGKVDLKNNSQTEGSLQVLSDSEIDATISFFDDVKNLLIKRQEETGIDDSMTIALLDSITSDAFEGLDYAQKAVQLLEELEIIYEDLSIISEDLGILLDETLAQKLDLIMNHNEEQKTNCEIPTISIKLL